MSLAAKKAARDKLRRRYESGVQALRDGERSVTNVSVAEMERVLAQLDAEIAALEGTVRPRVLYPHPVSRGL